MSAFLREKRLHRHGYIRRREEDNLSRKSMDMIVPGKRTRGRPRRRWSDNNREDMSKYKLTADMTVNRQYWKWLWRLAHKDVEMVSKGEKRWETCVCAVDVASVIIITNKTSTYLNIHLRFQIYVLSNARYSRVVWIQICVDYNTYYLIPGSLITTFLWKSVEAYSR